MKQFFYNSIHMTQGEFLLEYWWFWLGLALLLVGGWMAFDRIVCGINEPVHKHKGNLQVPRKGGQSERISRKAINQFFDK